VQSFLNLLVVHAYASFGEIGGHVAPFVAGPSDALLCTGAGRLIRGFCLPRRDHQTPGGIGSPKRSPDYKVRTAEPAPQTQATIQIVGRRSTGQSAEILLVDVAGRSLVVEEDHQGGSAVLGDGAFTAPGM